MKKILYDFKITYSIKALNEDKKWLENTLRHKTENILATSEELAKEQLVNIDEGIKIIIENIEKAEHQNFYLQNWANTHKPSNDMIYKNGYWEQIIFIRDTISEVLAKDYEDYKEIRNSIKVINTHISKSIELPVYYIELENISFVLRYDFYNWTVSVISSNEIKCNFGKLFNDRERSSCYYEEFPVEFIFGEYKNSNKNFSVEIDNNYKLYTFMFLIKNFINK